MSWMPSYQSLGQHPKTKRLARRLKICLPQAVGHLYYLWFFAFEYAQDGSLEQYDTEEIADAAQWTGDAQEFLDALLYAGFLDRDQDGLFLHDWHDRAGRLIERRNADAERKRNARTRMSDDCPEDVPQTSDGHPQDGGGTAYVDKKRVEDTRQEDTATADERYVLDALLPLLPKSCIDASRQEQRMVQYVHDFPEMDVGAVSDRLVFYQGQLLAGEKKRKDGPYQDIASAFRDMLSRDKKNGHNLRPQHIRPQGNGEPRPIEDRIQPLVMDDRMRSMREAYEREAREREAARRAAG